MDSNVKQTVEIMLGTKEIPQALIEKYDKVKLLNDKVSGGKMPTGMIAIIVSEFVKDKKSIDESIDWTSVKEGTPVFVLSKDDGTKKAATFHHYVGGGKYFGKLSIHYNDNKGTDNEMVDKEELHLEEE